MRFLNPAFRILAEPQPRAYTALEKGAHTQLASPKSSEEDATTPTPMTTDELDAKFTLFAKQLSRSQRHHNDEALRLRIDSFTVCYEEIAELTNRAVRVSEALQVSAYVREICFCALR